MPYPYDAGDTTAIANLLSYYNGNAYNASTNPGGYDNDGHRVNFVPTLHDLARVASAVSSAASAASTSATNAGTSETNAAASAAKLSGTSATSVLIGTGSKAFTTQASKFFNVGNFLLLSSNADATNYMFGQVTAYSGTALTVNVLVVGGSGTFADWNIAVSGVRGATGSTGSTGAAGPTGSTGRAAGFAYNFLTATSNADPGSGNLKFNNATLSSATALYISETDGDVNDLSTVLSTWDDATSTIRGRIFLVSPSAPTNFAIFNITGTLTDNGSWDTFVVAHVRSGGAFTNAMALALLFLPSGDKGDTGPQGVIGSAGGAITIPYTFSVTTTDSDPGNGVLRLNQATQNLATIIRTDLLDSNGADWTTAIDSLDDSSNVTDRGQIRLFKTADPSHFLVFSITGSVDSSSGYRNIGVAVTSYSSTNPFSDTDAISLTFTRSGNKGLDGVGSGTITNEGSVTTGNLTLWGADNQHIKDGGSPNAGRTFSGAINFNTMATVASATTTDIGAATSNYVQVTGTVTITGLGTIASGAVRIVEFAGILTLTHNATSLILPGGANITTAVGDVAVFISEGSGNWRCALYTTAASRPLLKANNLSDVASAATALSNLGAVAKAGDTLTGALNFATTVTIASSSTVNIGAAASNYVKISGTVTVTAFDTIAAGAVRLVEFIGALTLTHNATSLILPGAANISTAAGDAAIFVSEGSGNWRCLDYMTAASRPLLVANNLSDVASTGTTRTNLQIPFNGYTSSGTGTLGSSHVGKVIQDTGSGQTFTLPAASSWTGQVFIPYHLIGPSALTVARAGSDQIYGAAGAVNSLTLSYTNDFVALLSDGGNWHVVSASPAVMGGMLASNNLSDVASVPTAMTNLLIWSAALAG